METALFVTGVALLAGAGVMAFKVAGDEKARWNGGICRETGEPWVLFDKSSKGCRGYVSARPGARAHYAWISWPVDKAA